MEFWELLGINVILKYIYGFSTAYVVYRLADKKVEVKKLLLSLILFGIAEGSAVTFISMKDIELTGIISSNGYVFTQFAEVIIDFTYFVWLLQGLQKKRVFFLMVVSSMFTYTMTLLGIKMEDMTGLLWGYLPLNGNVCLALSTLLLTIIGYASLSRTRIVYYLRKLSEYPKIYISLGVLYYTLNIILAYMRSEISWWPVLYLILILGIAVLVREIENQKTIRDSKTMLLQQQGYVMRLENLQRELRIIQHDHKNLVAGLYAQASEGDLDAVKTYIDTKLLKVDAEVKENIRQINQLSQISLIELKGLILTKILEAEHFKTEFYLEVMNPVDRSDMQIEDLLRCIGILLDNAMEEVRKNDGASMSLLLLQESEKLTIVVDNPVQRKPDLNKIWQEGYSTKGVERGIGLSSFQQIIRKYPNVIHEVKVEEKRFIQILTIFNGA